MTLQHPETLVREALPIFGISSDAQITFIKYRENHVYRIDDGEHRYALRLHRPHYRNDREILTELRFVSLLHERGFNVPSILPTPTGELFTVVGDGEETRRVSIQHWIDGAEPVGDGNEAFTGSSTINTETFAETGRLLAQLHTELQTIGTPEWFERSPWDADGLAGESPLWGDPLRLRSLTDSQREIISGALEHLRNELTGLATDDAHFGVIHADLTVENIMTTPEGLRFIDFDDFGEGWYLFDLTTILFFFTPHPHFSRAKESLLRGYESVKPLTQQERDAWQAMMLARALTYLGWAADRPGDEASDFIEEVVAPWAADLAEKYTAHKQDQNETGG